ncbi:MAG: hypothetical protein ABII90_06315 [Bacteroidota bacterium]
MKKNIVICVILINLFNLCYAQDKEITEQKEKTKLHFNIGGNIYFGYSKINNLGSIDNYYNLIISENDTIEKKFTSKAGTIYGISGLANLVVNDRFHLNAGIQFQSQQNNIELQEIDDIPSQGSSYNKISSTANISVSSLAIPITAKVRFMIGDNNPYEGEIHPYLRVGISFETRLSKKLDFDENHMEYRETLSVTDTTYNVSFSNAKLDGYGTSAINFIIGAGLDFVLFEHDKTTFFIDMTLSTNFNQEKLCVSNLSSKSNVSTTNGEIFDKGTAEGLFINDWKSTHIGISIGLLF